jgi:hypothetical protein
MEGFCESPFVISPINGNNYYTCRNCWFSVYIGQAVFVYQLSSLRLPWSPEVPNLTSFCHKGITCRTRNRCSREVGFMKSIQNCRSTFALVTILGGQHSNSCVVITCPGGGVCAEILHLQNAGIPVSRKQIRIGFMN